jgi:hypothetical protein
MLVAALAAIAAAIGHMHVPIVHAPDRTILLAPCPGYPSLAACNYPDPKSPIYIRPEYYSVHVLYAELGGRFASVAMDQGARNRFAAIMGSRAQWDNVGENGAIVAFGLAEQFEDAYVNCAFGYTRRTPTLDHPEPARWITQTGYWPTPRQHRRVCALIRKAGTRAGLTIPAPPLEGHSPADPGRRLGARRAYRSTT